MQPNRLEQHWEAIKPQILKDWDILTQEDLEHSGPHFDRVLELIQTRYYPGRSRISVEGKIRDYLYNLLDALDYV